MTDREMLKFAAKAMGYDDAEWDEEGRCIVTAKLPGFRCFWNPLTDDGDCARMESELGIGIEWLSTGVVSRIWASSRAEYYHDHNGDKNAARRMASCMVAAQIGRDME